jgi:hypothetical protein
MVRLVFPDLLPSQPWSETRFASTAGGVIGRARDGAGVARA